MGKFTVLVANSLLGSSRFVGAFDSEDEAREYIARERKRARSFASFQVWTSREYGNPAGAAVQGEA